MFGKSWEQIAFVFHICFVLSFVSLAVNNLGCGDNFNSYIATRARESKRDDRTEKLKIIKDKHDLQNRSVVLCHVGKRLGTDCFCLSERYVRSLFLSL